MSGTLTAVRRALVVLLVMVATTTTTVITAHAMRAGTAQPGRRPPMADRPDKAQDEPSDVEIGTALKMVRNDDGTVTVYER